MARRHEEQKRTQALEMVLERLAQQVPKSNITWIAANTEQFFDQIMALVRSSAGQLNFHDALLALVCRERNIPSIASFDVDFGLVSWLSRISSVKDCS